MLFAILLSWCVVVAVLWIGWERAIQTKHRLPGGDVRMSVIIPVRNDARHVGRLLASLKDQTCPPHEILIIDDHSDDDLEGVVGRSGVQGITILKNPGVGKKQALCAGVHAASGDIIATTDADCVVTPQWLEQLAGPFADKAVKFAFGPVRIEQGNDLFSSLQSMEFLLLVGAGAAMAALGFPVMCNGANLCYRKDVFIETGGYEGNAHIASGDDEFLMRKVLTRFPDGVRYIGQKEAVVTTKPQPDVAAFVRQRLRWASKWNANTSLLARGTAVYVFIIQLAWLALIGLLLFSPGPLAWMLVVAKISMEWVLLRRISRHVSVRRSPVVFLLLQVLYPFYVLAIGTLSFFVPVQWKGRPVYSR